MKSEREKFQKLAERRMALLIETARGIPGLRKLGPKPEWIAGLALVGPAKMKALNRSYRGKDYATDVLSFPPPEVFRAQGQLGELVICLSVLKRQARELGHSPQVELDILLVHGLLHLLGMDHEQGPKQATLQAKWESRLLARVRPRAVAGLIDRAG